MNESTLSAAVGPERQRSGGRARTGAVLLIVGLLLLAAGRLIAGQQHHAYDPAGVPATSFSLIAGHTYQLSTSGGVAALQRQGVLGTGAPELQCSYTETSSSLAAGGAASRLSLLATYTDSRDLDAFAAFRAPGTGQFVLSCQQIRLLFVDDAEDAQPGWTTGLVLLSTVLLVAGVAVSLSAAYRKFGDPAGSYAAGDAAGSHAAGDAAGSYAAGDARAGDAQAGTVTARDNRPQPPARARRRRG